MECRQGKEGRCGPPLCQAEGKSGEKKAEGYVVRQDMVVSAPGVVEAVPCCKIENKADPVYIGGNSGYRHQDALVTGDSGEASG